MSSSRQRNALPGGSALAPGLAGAGGGGGGAIPPLTQWFFVDKNAPAGGDGSIASPFNTIGAAVAAAEVAAKTYVGPTGGLGAGVCVTGGGFFAEDLAWSDAVIYLWANLVTEVNSITITRTGDLPCGVCLDGPIGWTEGIHTWVIGASGSGNIKFQRQGATSDPADALCFLRNVSFTDDNPRSVEIALGGPNLEWDSGNGEIIVCTENVQAGALYFEANGSDNPTFSPAIWRRGVRTRSRCIVNEPTFFNKVEYLRDCSIRGDGGLVVETFDGASPGSENTIGLPLGVWSTILENVNRGSIPDAPGTIPMLIDSVTSAQQAATGGTIDDDFVVTTIG
jgi:hypothetical protein